MLGPRRDGDPSTQRPRVIIAGAGVAGLECALALHRLAGDRVTVEVLAPEHEFVLRALAVAEPFGAAPAPPTPLRRVFDAHGIEHRVDRLSAVEPEQRRVTTTGGLQLDYDTLVVATGVRAEEALPGAFTFAGPEAVSGLSRILAEAVDGSVRSMVFAAPAGRTWPLPLAELAIQTARFLFDRRIAGVELALVAPAAPLERLGAEARQAVSALLERHGVDLRLGSAPRRFADGALVLEDGGRVTADHVVAVPRLLAAAVPGLPRDGTGFVPVDDHGRVLGLERVYAAGDVTTFPLKHGSVAAAPADAVAEAVAAWAGAPIRPTPFRPVVRGLLLTGGEPAHVRADLGAGHHRTLTGAGPPGWWPPAKVAGRYLAPELAVRSGAG